jgi:DNA polymerase/3'-5' exonuclease PolX
MERLIAEGRLTEIPGVGGAIADIITKLHRTGTHSSLEAAKGNSCRRPGVAHGSGA